MRLETRFGVAMAQIVEGESLDLVAEAGGGPRSATLGYQVEPEGTGRRTSTGDAWPRRQVLAQNLAEQTPLKGSRGGRAEGLRLDFSSAPAFPDGATKRIHGGKDTGIFGHSRRPGATGSSKFVSSRLDPSTTRPASAAAGAWVFFALNQGKARSVEMMGGAIWRRASRERAGPRKFPLLHG